MISKIQKMIAQTASLRIFILAKTLTFFHFFQFAEMRLKFENPSPKENYHSVNCKCSINFVVPFALKKLSKLVYYVILMLRNDLKLAFQKAYGYLLQKLPVEIVRPILTH